MKFFIASGFVCIEEISLGTSSAWMVGLKGAVWNLWNLWNCRGFRCGICGMLHDALQDAKDEGDRKWFWILFVYMAILSFLSEADGDAVGDSSTEFLRGVRISISERRTARSSSLAISPVSVWMIRYFVLLST
jgi:hypothetical protein